MIASGSQLPTININATATIQNGRLGRRGSGNSTGA
jgi:hypothetical protein